MNLEVNIAKIFGKNSSLLHVASSAIFVLVLFFYIFSIGSYFQVGISPLENRVNHHESFLTYIISKHIDKIIIVLGTVFWLILSLLKNLRIIIPATFFLLTALVTLQSSTIPDIAVLFSFPIMLSLLIYNKFAVTKILNFSKNLNQSYLAVFFTALACISLAISSVPIFSLQSDKIPVRDYAYDIYLLFGSFSPFLISFLIIGSAARLLGGHNLTKILKIESPVLDSDKKSRSKISYLLLIMLLSVALSLIPHYPTININNQEVGADSADYVIMLRNLTDTKNSSSFVHQAFVVQQGGDRPFFLILLYGASKTTSASPSYLLDHLPVILAPALVLSVFLLTREITSNDRMSLFSAFVTAVSFQTLIGTYAGLYANLFALVIGYLSFVFLIRFLKKSSKSNFITYTLLMITLVFSHVYTWTILTLVTSIFLIVMYKLNHYNRKQIIILSLVVLLSVAIDVSRTIITNVHGGISEDIVLASTGAGLPQFLMSWSNLTDTMQSYMGGQFGNFIILGLGIYWLLRSNLHEPSNIFLAIFLSIGILPLILGNGLIQSRVFYDIPFQIPAGIALAYISRKASGSIIALSVCIWLVAISLRMVTNFYFVPPS